MVVKWTGGDANSLVRVGINSFPSVGAGAAGIYSYAPASSGSMTVNPHCDGPTGACSFGLSSAAGGIQLQVQVVPDPARLPAVTVPGITGRNAQRIEGQEQARVLHLLKHQTRPFARRGTLRRNASAPTRRRPRREIAPVRRTVPDRTRVNTRWRRSASSGARCTPTIMVEGTSAASGKLPQ